MGPYVPSPKFLTISGDPGRVIYQILDMEEIRFSLKKGVFTVDVRFELTSTTTHGLSTTAFVKALGLWATSKRLTNRLPKLSLITLSPQELTGYSGPDRIFIYSKYLYTGRRVTNSWFQFLGIQKFFSDS